MLHYTFSFIFFLLVFLCAALSSLEAQIKKDDRASGSLSSKAPPSISIRGRIQNGTTGAWLQEQSLPLELISLQNSMQVVQKKNSMRSYFLFRPIPRPTAPYLIRAQYQKGSFNLLIPPMQKFWQKEHILRVYEKGAKKEDIDIQSALSVRKHKGQLFVEKVFALHNRSRPPRTFAIAALSVFIPAKAQKLSAGLRYAKKNVAIPLQIQKRPSKQQAKEGDYYFFSRALHPGRAELSFRYVLESYKFRDQLWQLDKQWPENKERILLWRPQDTAPSISFAKYELVQIPQIGGAYKLRYTKEQEAGLPLSYRSYMDFSALGFLSSRASVEHSNALFHTPIESIAAVLLILLNLSFILPRLLLGRQATGRGRR